MLQCETVDNPWIDAVTCLSSARGRKLRGIFPHPGQPFGCYVIRIGQAFIDPAYLAYSGNVSFFLPEGMDRETTVNITVYILQVDGARAGNRPPMRTTDVVVTSMIR